MLSNCNTAGWGTVLNDTSVFNSWKIWMPSDTAQTWVCSWGYHFKEEHTKAKGHPDWTVWFVEPFKQSHTSVLYSLPWVYTVGYLQCHIALKKTWVTLPVRWLHDWMLVHSLLSDSYAGRVTVQGDALASAFVISPCCETDRGQSVTCSHSSQHTD